MIRFHEALIPLLRDIDDIAPHPENPNNGDPDAIEESIGINGMYRPVIVQRSTGYILAGNTTYAACMAMRSQTIPVIDIEVDDEGARRILIGDNQIARLARMDHGRLIQMLQELRQSEMRLLGTGFDEELSRLIGSFEEDGHGYGDGTEARQEEEVVLGEGITCPMCQYHWSAS